MADRLERRARERLVWRVLAVAAVVVAGLLLVTSRTTARGTDLRTEGRPDLTRLVARAEHRVDSELAQARRLRTDVAQLTRAAGPGGAAAAARRDARRLELPAGLRAVRGPAVRVTLDDAPYTPGDDLPDGIGVDDLVVHQQDVQAVVNALWAGGAEAMTIMDQRVISTSAVRCVGSTLLLQGEVYSPPYVVTAIGDPGRLRASLTAAPGVRIYRDYADVLGLGYATRTVTSTTMPAYDGPLGLMAAKAVPGR